MIIGLHQWPWDRDETFCYEAIAFPDRVVDNPFPFGDAETGNILIVGRDAHYSNHEKDSYSVLGESEVITTVVGDIEEFASRVVLRIPEMRRPEDRVFRVSTLGSRDPMSESVSDQIIETIRGRLEREGYDVGRGK